MQSIWEKSLLVYRSSRSNINFSNIIHHLMHPYYVIFINLQYNWNILSSFDYNYIKNNSK